jgi:hypothetical protein
MASAIEIVGKFLGKVYKRSFHGNFLFPFRSFSDIQLVTSKLSLQHETFLKEDP